MDPFEEIELAEKNAEQHRRSASEKEVRTDVLDVGSLLLCVCV